MSRIRKVLVFLIMIIIIIIVYLFIIAPMFFGKYYFINYSEYKEAAFQDSSAIFKIPKEWYITENGRYIYISEKKNYINGDTDNNLYMIGVKNYTNDKKAENYIDIYDVLDEKYELIEEVNGYALSAETNYGINKYVISGKESDLTYLNLSLEEYEVNLVSVDENVTKETVEKIAKSLRW